MFFGWKLAGKSAILKMVAPLVETLVNYSLNKMSESPDYTTICETLSVLETIAGWDAYQPTLQNCYQRRMTMVQKMLDHPSGLSNCVLTRYDDWLLVWS